MPCTGCAHWVIYSYKSAKNAEKQSQYTDLKSCLTFCVNSERCVAVDFDEYNKECWSHWNSDDLVEATMLDRDDVNLYVINRTCSTQGSAHLY